MRSRDVREADPSHIQASHSLGASGSYQWPYHDCLSRCLDARRGGPEFLWEAPFDKKLGTVRNICGDYQSTGKDGQHDKCLS